MGGCATKPKVLDKTEGEAEAPLPPEESIVTTAAVDTKEEKEKEKEVVIASSEAEQPGGSRRSLGLLLMENGESIGPPEVDEVRVKDTIMPPPTTTPDVEAEQPTKQEDPAVVEHSETKAPVVEVASVDSTSSNTVEVVEILKGEEALQLAAGVVKKESAAAEKVGDAELPATS